MILVSAPAPFRSSTVRDAAQGHPSRSTVALCSQKRHQSTAKVRHQPIVASAPSSEPSRVTPRDIPVGSLWPTSLTLQSKMGHLWVIYCGCWSLFSSSESSEQDTDREPASAAAAAGHSCLLHPLPLSCKIQLIVKS